MIRAQRKTHVIAWLLLLPLAAAALALALLARPASLAPAAAPPTTPAEASP